MKKLLLTLTLASMFSQTTLAKEGAAIQFFCDSGSKPTYEFPVDSNGSVKEVRSGHFSEQVLVNELEFRDGGVRVELIPFHPYCSVSIKYQNYTNSSFNTDGNLLFSKLAIITASCEGGPIQNNECSIKVK